MTLGAPEGVILLVIVLVLFGGSQLPKLARNLGRAHKELREGMQESTRDDAGPNPSSGEHETASRSPTDPSSARDAARR